MSDSGVIVLVHDIRASSGEESRSRSRVSSRVIDRHLVRQDTRIHAREAFDPGASIRWSSVLQITAVSFSTRLKRLAVAVRREALLEDGPVTIEEKVHALPLHVIQRGATGQTSAGL